MAKTPYHPLCFGSKLHLLSLQHGTTSLSPPSTRSPQSFCVPEISTSSSSVLGTFAAFLVWFSLEIDAESRLRVVRKSLTEATRGLRRLVRLLRSAASWWLEIDVESRLQLVRKSLTEAAWSLHRLVRTTSDKAAVVRRSSDRNYSREGLSLRHLVAAVVQIPPPPWPPPPFAPCPQIALQEFDVLSYPAEAMLNLNLVAKDEGEKAATTKAGATQTLTQPYKAPTTSSYQSKTPVHPVGTPALTVRRPGILTAVCISRRPAFIASRVGSRSTLPSQDNPSTRIPSSLAWATGRRRTALTPRLLGV